MRSFSSKQSPYVPLHFSLHRPWSSKRRLRLGFLNSKVELSKKTIIRHGGTSIAFSKFRRRAQLQETRRRNRMIVVKAEIEKRNMKLYKENQSIIEENEKLRKQAVLLHIENQALLSQLQKKLSEENNNKSKH